MECKYDVISDEEDFPETPILTSNANPLIAIQAMALGTSVPTHRRQHSISPAPTAVPVDLTGTIWKEAASLKPSSKIFFPALEPPRARMFADPPAASLVPTGGGYTIANAFGAAPPLPCPLNVVSVTTPIVTTGQINRLDGSPAMTLDLGVTRFNGSQLSDLTSVTTNAVDFGLGSALTRFVNVSGAYSLATGIFGAVSGGTYKLVGIGGTGFGGGVAATQYTLHLSAFTGTAEPVVTPPSSVTITFSPDIVQYLPARGTISTFVNDAQLSSFAIGTITVEQITPTAIFSITDSDTVSNWQWKSGIANQGWFEQDMTWTV